MLFGTLEKLVRWSRECKQYLFLRAWVGFDPDDATSEPALTKLADETVLVVDSDHRGLGLLKHVRKQLKKEWKFKAKEEQPDTNPTLQLETRAPERAEAQFEGMAVPLLFIDFPEHETVALATLEANVPDWRGLIPNVANGEAIATIMLGTDQLSRVAKVSKLYAKSPAIWHFNGPEAPVSVSVGPIHGLLMPTSASASEGDLDDDDDQLSMDDGEITGLSDGEEDDDDE